MVWHTRNHLDVQSCAWLERFLQDPAHGANDQILVVVSHDRGFVDAVVTDVVLLDGASKKLEYFRGDYTSYEEQRATKRKLQRRAFERQTRARSHIQAFIDKFRYNAKRASIVQSRIKSLKRMELIADVIDDPEFRFDFPLCGPLSRPIIEVEDVSFGYGGAAPTHPQLFEGVNFGLDLESRVCILGVNGAGKSTLVRLARRQSNVWNGVAFLS